MFTRAIKVAAPVLAAAAVLVSSVTPALAHERRTLGDYAAVVGFLVEPAFVNGPNGVDLRLTNATTNQPVAEGDVRLAVQIAHESGLRWLLPIRARGTAPGAYTADFTPPLPGRYSFQFFGNIGDSRINSTFTSGPGTFSNVEVPAAGVTVPPSPAGAQPATAVPPAFANLFSGIFGALPVAR